MCDPVTSKGHLSEKIKREAKKNHDEQRKKLFTLVDKKGH